MKRVTRSCKQNTHEMNAKNCITENQKKGDLIVIEYKRITRNSIDKQNTLDKKCKLCTDNHITKSQKNVSKVISKRVRVSTRNIKRAVRDYIDQSSPLVQNNIIHKTKPDASKESPIKRVTRQTTLKLANQNVANASDHVPSPFLEKAAENTIAKKPKRARNKNIKESLPNAVMEEPTKDTQAPAVESEQNEQLQRHQSTQNLVIVVDTNVFTQALHLVKNLATSYFVGYIEKPTLLVPLRVFIELEAESEQFPVHNQKLKKLAAEAVAYLYDIVPKKLWVNLQSLSEDRDHLFDFEVPDDSVLNCCLQQERLGNSVILLSNDRNLCSRATTKDICNMSSLQIASQFEDRPLNYAELNCSCYRTYKAKIYTFLSTILMKEMEKPYHPQWILSINPPWSLVDVIDCFLNHWYPVFKTVFPRIRYQMEQLRDYTYRLNNMFTLDNDILRTYQKMCLLIAHKCIIVADYLPLAIDTIASLKEETHIDLQTKEIRQEKTVNKVFSHIFIYFSSYCANLCTLLGISHFLQHFESDTTSPDELLQVFPLFNKHLLQFTRILREALNAGPKDAKSHLENLNYACIEVNPNFAFIDKGEIEPVWYMNKCRDIFIKHYKLFDKMTELFTRCSIRIRRNALLAPDDC